MKPVFNIDALGFSSLGIVLLIAACSSTPHHASPPTAAHTVHVAQDIQPLQINAGKGDEIRWVNQRSYPVAVIFPATDASRISCQKGFQTVDRTALSAVLAPNSSASLCFSENGKYDYRVRLDENIASAATDRNASVWIVGRGERNPKPGEQFENITP
jgi:plastocyanin